MPVSDSVKADLAGDQQLADYKFYVELASLFAPVFPQIPTAQLRELTVYSYLYFRYVLNLDCLLDGEISRSEEGTRTILAYQTVHEVAIRGLAKLFPEGDAFWPAFTRCKQDFLVANVAEKRIDATRAGYSRQQFEDIAEGKAAVCYAMIHALCSLGQDWQHQDQLLACMRYQHVGDQYFDDVMDFVQDWERQQYSYPHHLVESFITGLGLDPAAQSLRRRQQFFYTSGIADTMLEQGKEMKRRTRAIAEAFGLTAFMGYLDRQIQRAALQQANIAQVLAKAKEQLVA